jgi:cytochrome P450
MNLAALAPTYIGRLASMPILARIVGNSLSTMRQLHRSHGAFVVLTYPQSRRTQPRLLGVVSDSSLYQKMFLDGERWRNVNIVFRGFLNDHASQRLGTGFTRLRGARHTHYRRLIAKPLSRPSVAAMSTEMAQHARNLVSAWPRDKLIDLVPLTQNIMQGLAVGLLFGGEYERAESVTRMIQLQNEAFRFIPGRAYLTWFMNAAKQERLILDWASEKQGKHDLKDILSIITNSPDEQGAPPSREIIAGLLSFTFGAAYESCQKGLAWTLVMLAQHPDIAGNLAEEIQGALRGDLPTMDAIDALPLLDGVVKEGLRLFPPVPILARKSTVKTMLGAAEFEAGTRVFVNCYLINRNPDIYPEPQRFRPERWNGFTPEPRDYAVFGTGGRTCPGFIFASQMVKISIATILTRFRVEVASGARIDYRHRVMLEPHPGIPVMLRSVDRVPRVGRIEGRINELVDLSQQI